MMYRIILLILLSVGVSFGQNSLLWQITKDNVKDTSYLYGTIHLANKKYFHVNSKVHELKKKVDAGIFEIVFEPDSMAFIVSSLKANPGEKLKDICSVEEQNTIFNYFKTKLGLQELVVNQFKPIALTPFLFQIVMPPDTIGAIDQLLQNDFKRMGKTVASLESVQMQCDLLYGLPIDYQKQDLLDAIQKEDSLQTAIYQLDSVYRNQDIKGIALLLDELKNHEYLSKELLNDSRNIKMIPKIEILLSQQSNLICVGAAHLSGEKGLINLLRLKGYTISAVF
ncbi:MAG: TraB/GumN family protein [Flavobacteriales bacterium]